MKKHFPLIITLSLGLVALIADLLVNGAGILDAPVMLAVCGTLTRSFVQTCATPTAGGIGGDSRAVVYNYGEVSFTESSTTPNLLTAITLSSGASGYQIQGYKVSLKPSAEAVDDQAGVTRWKHNIAFLVFANSQLVKNEIQRMALGRYVFTYENNGKNEDSFEVMGRQNGMIMKPQKVRDLQENSSAYMLTFATPDNELEPMLPATFFITSYAASLAAINATLYLPTITTISDLTVDVAGGNAETITGTNFFGSAAASSEVVSVVWINTSTQARTTQTGVTVASATSITFNTVALSAGVYQLEITTKKGIALSPTHATAS